MRMGLPASSTIRSSGPAGQPSGAPFSGVLGLTSFHERAVRIPGGVCFGYGGLWRKPPGASMVPSRLINTARARMVWKPLECAASPRMA
ncbi:hypothetical protein GALL_493510 [mine drainage metagenome]|uniref:Uncharacterized protein n=1 Tax=mine drainage metagenome TaxID=410659 RepID=A0A1J5PBK7_9ZZZZ